MSANLTRRVQTPRTRLTALAPTLLTGMLLAPLLMGCQAAGPHAANPVAVPSETNAELVEYISDQPYVSAEAAYRAVFILAKGEIFHGDYEALATEMRGNGLIGQTWSYASDTFVDRAAIGFLVPRACHIRSGLNWQVTGLGRYAYRELIFRRIAHPSGELGLISGGEFLGVLARAEEYLRKAGESPEPTAELGEPPAK